MGRGSNLAKDLALRRAARRAKSPVILWDVEAIADNGVLQKSGAVPLRAAE